jgi:hypothetical protein
MHTNWIYSTKLQLNLINLLISFYLHPLCKSCPFDTNLVGRTKSFILKVRFPVRSRAGYLCHTRRQLLSHSLTVPFYLLLTLQKTAEDILAARKLVAGAVSLHDKDHGKFFFCQYPWRTLRVISFGVMLWEYRATGDISLRKWKKQVRNA